MKSLQVNNLQPMYYNENSPGLQYMEYFPQQNLSFNLIDTLEPNIFTEVIWISFYFINPSQKASMFSIFSVSFSLSV